MKYTVTLNYRGSYTVEVEASSRTGALAAARESAINTPDNEFFDSLDVYEESHDIKEV